MSKKVSLHDRKLLAHVAEAVRAAERPLDAEECAEELCARHTMYRRRKRRPFVKTVAGMIEALTGGDGPSDPSVPEPPSQGSEDAPMEDAADPADPFDALDAAEDEILGDARDPEPPAKRPRPAPNMLNRNMQQMYKKKSRRASGPPAPSTGDGGGFAVVERPTARYSDLGGMDDVLAAVRENVEYPLTHPELYAHLGVEPPRGILLHGPPGCGKTALANAIAGELGVAFLKIAAPEIVSGMSGESESRLRDLFREAAARAPSIVFIDEIDAITPKRDNAQREMERRIVAQLLSSMDDLTLEKTKAPVIVIGATNRPDALDAALRRAGRFDREISIGIPDDHQRARILQVMTSKLRIQGDFDYLRISRRCAGFVGADLSSLAKEAAVIAVNRIFRTVFGTATGDQDPAALLRETPELSAQQLDPLFITERDFDEAVPKVQPSAKREGFATIPDVTWDDIGALEQVRDELMYSIVYRIAHPERYEAMGLVMPAGALLFGPPGCGKTLLAKAVAHESHANFISVKGPELLNKYVGESERAIRQVFQRGRASAPCVIFFDELDALCPRRGTENTSSAERVVNQLLTEMDGLDQRRNVFVIAATNRPDMIDPAMLRPGRLDRLLYVPLPQEAGRLEILRTAVRNTPLAPDVNVQALAADARCAGFSGADLTALVREASIVALRESMDAGQTGSAVGAKHFDVAFQKVFPSVSERDAKAYDRLQRTIRRSRVVEEAP